MARDPFQAGAFPCGVLHVLPAFVWVSSSYTGFLPQPKVRHVRLTGLNGESKLPTGVNGSGSLSLNVGPEMKR